MALILTSEHESYEDLSEAQWYDLIQVWLCDRCLQPLFSAEYGWFCNRKECNDDRT